jgi:ATP-binding protein involved in chromosome partitioning
MFSFFKPHTPVSVALIKETIYNLADGFFEIEDIKLTKEGHAIVVLQPLPDIQDLTIQHHKIERALSDIAGVKKSVVVLTNQKSSPPETLPKPKNRLTELSGLPPIVIAVASGKGGVGKSTVAVNLAIAFSQMGKKVGILDADIYGPSLPRLLGCPNDKALQGEDTRLQPIEAHGLKAMSMGFMVDEATAMIWRGPMAQSAILQMLRDVNWDGLDMLVIDMPPGTGDIHLTLAQRVKLSGGVVVSTPQDIALIDARKGLEMFQKVAVPILGIVENMSYYSCPKCGNHDDIFGHGGARDEATKIGVPFLGEIPLHSLIRRTSDAGTPVTLSETESDQARAFIRIAENVISGLQVTQKPAPLIRMEE